MSLKLISQNFMVLMITGMFTDETEADTEALTETPVATPTILISKTSANDVLVLEEVSNHHHNNSTHTDRRSRVPHSKHKAKVDHFRARYPHAIVWSPIPVVSWFLPFIGHIGIAYTNGKIRDFADAFIVSEDKMSFGKPTKYWELKPDEAEGGFEGWDRGVFEAAEEYTTRDHDTICDNSASMVALALNLMNFQQSTSWNMFWVIFLTLIHSKYTGCGGFFRTYGPCLSLIGVGCVIGFSAWKLVSDAKKN